MGTLFQHQDLHCSISGCSGAAESSNVPAKAKPKSHMVPPKARIQKVEQKAKSAAAMVEVKVKRKPAIITIEDAIAAGSARCHAPG